VNENNIGYAEAFFMELADLSLVAVEHGTDDFEMFEQKVPPGRDRFQSCRSKIRYICLRRAAGFVSLGFLFSRSCTTDLKSSSDVSSRSVEC
jgi:hypothetical protein